MAKVKNLNAAIAKEPEAAGVEIQRKNPGTNASGQAPASPKTAGAPPKRTSALADPFTARRSDKTPRPTDTPGE
jgi:hypothetical protein